jgi:GH24 family phage-related lysozyme (muramidase)
MISKPALDLILDSEGCDLKPAWPGGASGVTYGRGYDLGYNTKEQIKRDWAAHVNGNVLAFMLSCSGIKGEAAKRLITPTTRVLTITQAGADKVFEEATLPRFEKLAMNTYPGLMRLPEDTIGAIVSLVFNRGTSFGTEGQPSWQSRREMRELAPLIQDGDLQAIADKIRAMCRLWEGKGLNGLITRRKREADLIHQ